MLDNSRDYAARRVRLGRAADPRRRWFGFVQIAADRVLAIPRPAKRTVAVAVDIGLCALSTYFAFYLRLGEWGSLGTSQWIALTISVVIAIPLFVVSGLYRAIFRYSGESALLSIAQAGIVYGLGYAAIITVVQIPGIPRTVGIIQPVLLFLFVAGSRVIAGWWLGGAYVQLLHRTRERGVMIYGAGSAGRQLFKALGATDMRVRGFIDDDPLLHGRVLFGRPIFSPADIADLVRRYGVTDILLALPSASRKRRAEILSLMKPLAVAVRAVPGMLDVAEGRVRIDDMREVDLDDLLGREAVVPDETLLSRNIRGKVVLVTGAGGSIGSELCRQVIAMDAEVLLLVEMSEPALYTIHQELESRLATPDRPNPRLVPLLASVCDPERMRQIIEIWRPDTIYHAAAYKHVPLVEHNPAIGVWNNVFGTLTMAQAACRGAVSDFVFISTDKAVRPTNVMGATKRLAEQVLQALAAGQPKTLLSMVRFGNVLGSSGSVVPLFRQQIEGGGPVTVTHPNITRYFMSVSEAAQLVIQAGAMAEGGEVFVLDMGSPVKIVDLAKMMVELSGATLRDEGNPDGDIEIAFVGLRPGEKLYEELLIGNNPSITLHPRIMKANENFLPWAQLSLDLGRLESLTHGREIEALITLLQRLVPEYAAGGTPVDWLHLRLGENGGDQAVDEETLAL